MAEVMNRRAALGSIVASAAMVATPAAAALAPYPDAELIALDMKIRELVVTAKRVVEERFDPFEDQFREIACNEASGRSAEQRWKMACKFGHESGREAAAQESNALWGEADRLLERLCGLGANTSAGRAAKVRAHLVMTFPQDWLHESAEWDVEKSLILLAELAGVPLTELALSNEAAAGEEA
jgi:hypothetical protein